MKNKLPTVSIGIPAYNEEANIEKLIKSLLKQKQDGFKLKEIIIISDESTDKTDEIVKKIKNKKISLIRNKKRIGQALSQNIILNKFSGNILVLLNADILPFNNFLIKNLIMPITNNNNIGIVSGDLVPTKGKNLVESALNMSVAMKREIYEKINNKINIFLCRGPMRAFSKSFANEFHFKPIISEDAFSYLSCISKGYEFFYEPSAKIYFKSPENIKDHLKQSVRFLKSSEKFQEVFNPEFVKKEYSIPHDVALSISFKYFLKNPFLFLTYFCILSYTKIRSISGFEVGHIWNVSSSSKKLGKI